MVQRSKPLSKIIYSIQAEPQSSSEPVADEASTRQFFLMVLITLLGLATFATGAIYWYQTRHFPVVVAISPPEARDKDAFGKPGALIPIDPEMLHVTSIALGNPRLTIVNGKRLAEQDWLVVKTPSGEAGVRVISIQDGLVKFMHGGETIDAHLQALLSPAPH